VLAAREGRVLYAGWDEKGKRIQANGCVSQRHADEHWRPV